MKTLRLIGCLVLALLAHGSLAQSGETGFLNRSLTLDGSTHRYQVYVPAGYDGSRDWPVILFLHGAGERGDDGLKPTDVGLGRAIRLNPERWPAIAVFPQVPQGESWQGVAGRVAVAALDQTMTEYAIDDNRQYLTGLSLGGNGTWFLGYHHTERFAALVAICSFLDLGERYPAFLEAADPYQALAADLASKPVWLFHGDADSVVPVDQSRRMAWQLKAAGAAVQYTELPGVGHNAWDPAYRNEEMIAWLFRQRN